MFVSRSFRFTFDVFSFHALLSSKNAPHSFLLQKTHTCHGYLSELCVHCRVFFLGGMVAICDISEYRSCIKEFKVIKNIRTVVLACWLFSPHLFSLLKWNRMNRGQFNYPVSERTQWQLVLNFDALISGHYSVPSLPHPIEWMFLGRIVVQTCYIGLCILVRLCVPRGRLFERR